MAKGVEEILDLLVYVGFILLFLNAIAGRKLRSISVLVYFRPAKPDRAESSVLPSLFIGGNKTSKTLL